MPYIGNTAANRFVAPEATTRLSGNGSATAFTLEHSVGSDEDILVSVDGVIQEPSVAYAVSNGTTLTFTAAPSNGTNNIFVCYLFRTVGTVSHPSNNALSASTGTFTGDLTVDTSTLKVDSTNNRIGVGVASPSSSLHIRTADSSATAQSGSALVIEGTDATRADLQFLGDAGAFQAIYFGDNSDADIGRIAYDHTGNSMRFTVNAAECMRIDSTGAITKPLQPAFLVEPSNNAANQNIAVGSDVTVTFGTEIFDQNGDFASNTFTAPVTGKYQLQTGLRVQSLSYSINYYFVLIKTSNRSYINILDPDFGQDSSYFTFTLSVLADMDANDTAIVTIYQPTGTQQTDIIDDSFFSGYLVA